jgi:DnaJ-class molecular chaperone
MSTEPHTQSHNPQHPPRACAACHGTRLDTGEQRPGLTRCPRCQGQGIEPQPEPAGYSLDQDARAMRNLYGPPAEVRRAMAEIQARRHEIQTAAA